MRTTDFGDDKDRVLTRSDGENTYFASDIANHQQKLARGFDLLIDVWGADHHGYVRRMRAALVALGADPEAFEVVILQFVHLIEGSERASMSKRRGEFVTLDELFDRIGVDAARYFLTARAPETTVDLDLDLARERSNENPVYYVQYAHARIASLLARAGGRRVAAALEQAAGADVELHPSERALLKKLLAFPGRSPRPPRGARRTESPPTRWSWPRSSPPSTATAASWAPSPRRSSRGASPCRWPRSARFPARWTCSA